MRPAHFFIFGWVVGWMAFFGLFTIPAIGLVVALYCAGYFLGSLSMPTVNLDVYSRKFMHQEGGSPFLLVCAAAILLSAPFVAYKVFG